MSNSEISKAGFIAIIGRPNVGKSTMLNKMVGEKLAAVSDKPQTTRTRILAILNRNKTQMIFLDTPGFHRPKTQLGSYMVKVVSDSIKDVDCALMVAEPDKAPSAIELEIIEKLKQAGIPAVLAINKIDTVNKEKILPVISAYSQQFDFEAIVPVCAKSGEGMEAVIDELDKLMEKGEWFYPEDMLTDQPERAIAAEIIREKILLCLSDEVPHGTAVEILKMRDRDNGIIDISATIICEKASHKGIIIGKQGKMLKKIGTLARIDMENFFEQKIFLELWVKVREDWRNKKRDIHDLGFKNE
jgi:GTP-binding protein Era